MKLSSRIRKILKRSVAYGLATFLTCSVVMNATNNLTQVEALGLIDSALVGVAEYNRLFMKYREDLDDALVQAAFLKGSEKYNGPISNDEKSNKIVDEVMHQLLDNGFYAMDAYALPFEWRVVENDDMNAVCYGCDYIAVYTGFLQKVHYNKDEIAGALGHEITHGLRHHAALGIAKTYAVNTGLHMFFSDKNVSPILVYALCVMNHDKNAVLPYEYDADSDGMYIMFSAGFNPGGAGAMATIMRRDELEKYGVERSKDHPYISRRIENYSKILTELSMGHVTIMDKVNVCVDGEVLLTATPDGDYTDEEMAWFIAGGLAKGFHDNKLATSWWFTKNAKDEYDFLDNNDVYQIMKKAIKDHGLSAKLEELVNKAYSNDSKTGDRSRIYANELDRINKWKEINVNAKEKSKETIKRRQANAKKYRMMGNYDKAMVEVNRAFACDPDNADSYAIRGSILAGEGKYDESLNDINTALAKDPKNENAFLARAVANYSTAKYDEALKDCEAIEKVNKKNPYVYQLEGLCYSALGNTEKATSSNDAFKKIMPDLVTRKEIKKSDEEVAKEEVAKQDKGEKVKDESSMKSETTSTKG